MPTTAIIPGGTNAALGPTAPTTRTFSDMSSEDFLALLIQQLRSQDPLKPTDNQQLLEQMSSIRQMEQSVTLNQALTSLAAEQRFGATAALIGQYVHGNVTNDAGETRSIQGLVIGVEFAPNGEAILDLHNGATLPASKVDLVTRVENLPEDLQQQLQDELGEGGVPTDPTSPTDGDTSAAPDSPVDPGSPSDPGSPNNPGTPTDPNSTGRIKFSTVAPRPGDWLRGLADSTDRASVILSSLLSPHYGVSFGK